ncbi:MRPL6_2 [Sanghuangporus weigelae]
MTQGFSVPLYLVGHAASGDDPRGTTEGDRENHLSRILGSSHAVFVPVPAHLKAEVPSPTKTVKVRSFRRPDPYKKKGDFVGDKTIRINQVKRKNIHSLASPIASLASLINLR